MGWSYGHNLDGREVGYAVEADCDHPGCDAEIDRGLGYACGEQHDAGEDDRGVPYCAGYYCSKHLGYHDCEAEAETIRAWVVSGPGREYDETWFAFGADKQAMEAVQCAEEWLTECWDQMTPNRLPKISVSIEIREVTQEDLEIAWDAAGEKG